MSWLLRRCCCSNNALLTLPLPEDNWGSTERSKDGEEARRRGSDTSATDKTHTTIFNLPTKNILSFTNHAQRRRANCGRCVRISWTKIENDENSPNLFHLKRKKYTHDNNFKEWELGSTEAWVITVQLEKYFWPELCVLSLVWGRFTATDWWVVAEAEATKKNIAI